MDTFETWPRVTVTGVFARPSIAALVKTHDLRSGRSSAVPRSVHPDGVVVLTLRFAVTTRTRTSLATTDDGTRTVGLDTLALLEETPRKATWLGGGSVTAR